MRFFFISLLLSIATVVIVILELYLSAHLGFNPFSVIWVAVLTILFFLTSYIFWLFKRNKVKKMNIILNLFGYSLPILIFFILPITQRFQIASHSKEKITTFEMSLIVAELNNFRKNCGKYPDNLFELTYSHPECGHPFIYMKKIPKDQWDREFMYKKADDSFQLYSLGGKNGEIHYSEK